MLVSPGLARADTTLEIEPAIQQTYVWCWVAVSEMVFSYYDASNLNPRANFQCGIVGTMSLGTMAAGCAQNCLQPQCIRPAGTLDNLARVIEEYPRRAASFSDDDQPKLKTRALSRSLSFDEVKDEIDAENPVIVGINPSGRPAGYAPSEHVALIVGYEDEGEMLIVNDPAPFEDLQPFAFSENPYEAAGGEELESQGQYKISYDDFVDGLNWGETIKVRRSGTYSSGGSGLPHYCCTIAGRLGPYPNTQSRAGEACIGVHPVFGAIGGAACY